MASLSGFIAGSISPEDSYICIWCYNIHAPVTPLRWVEVLQVPGSESSRRFLYRKVAVSLLNPMEGAVISPDIGKQMSKQLAKMSVVISRSTYPRDGLLIRGRMLKGIGVGRFRLLGGGE
jgi:hypothetical protein